MRTLPNIQIYGWGWEMRNLENNILIQTGTTHLNLGSVTRIKPFSISFGSQKLHNTLLSLNFRHLYMNTSHVQLLSHVLDSLSTPPNLHTVVMCTIFLHYLDNNEYASWSLVDLTNDNCFSNVKEFGLEVCWGKEDRLPGSDFDSNCDLEYRRFVMPKKKKRF